MMTTINKAHASTTNSTSSTMMTTFFVLLCLLASAKCYAVDEEPAFAPKRLTGGTRSQDSPRENNKNKNKIDLTEGEDGKKRALIEESLRAKVVLATPDEVLTCDAPGELMSSLIVAHGAAYARTHGYPEAQASDWNLIPFEEPARERRLNSAWYYQWGSCYDCLWCLALDDDDNTGRNLLSNDPDTRDKILFYRYIERMVLRDLQEFCGGYIDDIFFFV